MWANAQHDSRLHCTPCPKVTTELSRRWWDPYHVWYRRLDLATKSCQCSMQLCENSSEQDSTVRGERTHGRPAGGRMQPAERRRRDCLPVNSWSLPTTATTWLAGTTDSLAPHRTARGTHIHTRQLDYCNYRCLQQLSCEPRTTRKTSGHFIL